MKPLLNVRGDQDLPRVARLDRDLHLVLGEHDRRGGHLAGVLELLHVLLVGRGEHVGGPALSSICCDEDRRAVEVEVDLRCRGARPRTPRPSAVNAGVSDEATNTLRVEPAAVAVVPDEPPFELLPHAVSAIASRSASRGAPTVLWLTRHPHGPRPLGGSVVSGRLAAPRGFQAATAASADSRRQRATTSVGSAAAERAAVRRRRVRTPRAGRGRARPPARRARS